MKRILKNIKTNRVLIGKRVYLRKPTMEDCHEFLTLNRRSVRFHQGWISPPKIIPLFVAYLNRCDREDNQCFFIVRKQDDAIVGVINLSQIFRGGFLSAYLGYYIGVPYAGQGYMTEAMQLVLRYAFKVLKLHRLEANVQPDNKASIALVQRTGFHKEGYSKRYLKVCGRWRDHERWAILSEEWKENK